MVFEKDIKILETKGLLQVKRPNCLGDQPAFKRRLQTVRETFAGRLIEEEFYKHNTLWIEFTLDDST